MAPEYSPMRKVLPSFEKVKAGGRNKILCGKAGFGKVAPGKLSISPARWGGAGCAEAPAVPAHSKNRLDAQGLKVVQHIRFHTLQAHFRGTQVVRLNAKSDIFPFGKAVIAFFQAGF